MHRHILIVICLAILTLLPRTSWAQHTFSSFAFADTGPRAAGVGGAGNWSFGDHLQLGALIDAYTPYEHPDQPDFEAFALLHISASLFVARLHLGVGSNLEGNWTPRGFLILTLKTRVAPWMNIYTSIPTNEPSATYAQVRLGVRASLSDHWMTIVYLEVPFAPTLRLPFADGDNHLGLTAIYSF